MKAQPTESQNAVHQEMWGISTNPETQAQIHQHCVAAILSLETVPGGEAGAGGNLEECGDSLWRVVPWAFLPLSMDDFIIIFFNGWL